MIAHLLHFEDPDDDFHSSRTYVILLKWFEDLWCTSLEKIGTALANGAADQASTLFAKYRKQILELQGSMGRVVRELRVMHDVLFLMDIRNRNNQVYEGWLEEVRKVAHVMEDMVDEYLYLVGHEHDTGCCFYLKKGFTKPRYLVSLNRIAFKVKEIEKDLAHLSETKNRWVHMINNGDASSSSYIVKRSKDLANISRSLDEEDLVGVDKNRDKLEQWLLSDDLEHSVIALLGMGGLGKTSLAANVYRKHREKFQCHAWVSISQTYSTEHVLRNIIKEISRDKVSVLSNTVAMDITCLEETLRKFLEQQKYLIILDDVWTPEAFDDLSRVLINNRKGSRLMITTREGDVAALASQGHTLTLKPLPEDKAWDLFCRKAFPRDTNHECPAELNPLSEQIVSKCKGLPLVIVLFSEDYCFKRKQLIRLWTAEGFIEERGESTLEEVAEGYLKELIDRNMLELVKRNSFGRMKEFKMHDILRELALDLCQKNCFGVTYEDKRGGSFERNGRRLVLHKQKKDIQQSFSSVRRLRTFVMLEDSMVTFTLLPMLCKESRYMTVLELSGLPIDNIPDAIGDLFNLHHLGLRDSKVKMLPSSVEKLSNLLTLDLLRSDVHELPSGIVKLKKLRHLFVEKRINTDLRGIKCFSGVHVPNGLGNLTNLQTLQALVAHDESIRHLRQLRQLRSLRLLDVKGSYCGRISESLVQMQCLSHLDVNASDENEVLSLNVPLPNLQRLRLGGQLAEGALDESPLFQAAGGQNLHVLNLYWSQLREDPLPSLSRLSNLTHLEFTRAYNGEQLAFLTGWFPKLKILYLIDLPNLNWLEIQQGAMASLERLYLVNLSSMMEVPPGIEFLMPLQFLGFFEITSDFSWLLDQCSVVGGTQWRYTL
ncbi:Disease resistance protein RPM1 [Triticum urartu]|uniref:Disease resistance protein RPM1 n=1 Tax=Triticum urartu TaxID=4572 RepID=M7YUX3_TRIUA|nr:Disease resistance protein RPM1 [Triticum urartu]